MQKLSRKLGTPLHHQISTVIKDGIATGRYQSGERLPTEDALCKLFAVSRITVRRAMQSLEEQGLIGRRRGDGTFVSASVSVGALQTPLSSFTEPAAESPSVTTRKVESFCLVSPPPHIRLALHLASDEQAWCAVRLRLRDDVPIVHSTTFLPRDIGGQLGSDDLASHALSELLLRAGFAYFRIEASSGASLADPTVARSLRVGVGEALVDVRRVAFDKDGRPIQYQNVLGPPDRFQMRMTIRA